MWVFGYGSLMWDGWEGIYGCTRKEIASLRGFRRDFNKASVQNWGSEDNPGPTLGLSPGIEAECFGLAFELPDEERDRVLKALKDREGRSFTLEEKEVELRSGARIRVLVPVNDRSRSTYIGDRSLEDRARLAKTALGSSGTCVDYRREVRERLRRLGIEDSSVRAILERGVQGVGRVAEDRLRYQWLAQAGQGPGYGLVADAQMRSDPAHVISPSP